MKELIKAIRIVQKQFNEKGHVIKNCEGNKFYGSFHFNINEGKIVFAENKDVNGVIEQVKI